jgi:hypothetical protein
MQERHKLRKKQCNYALSWMNSSVTFDKSTISRLQSYTETARAPLQCLSTLSSTTGQNTLPSDSTTSENGLPTATHEWNMSQQLTKSLTDSRKDFRDEPLRNSARLSDSSTKAEDITARVVRGHTHIQILNLPQSTSRLLRVTAHPSSNQSQVGQHQCMRISQIYTCTVGTAYGGDPTYPTYTQLFPTYRYTRHAVSFPIFHTRRCFPNFIETAPHVTHG